MINDKQDINNHINSINTTELLKKVEEYKKIDLSKISFEDLTNKLRETISSYIISTSIIKENTKLYRIRKLNNKDSIKSFDDIWFPKPEVVTNYGRANRKGNPIVILMKYYIKLF